MAKKESFVHNRKNLSYQPLKTGKNNRGLESEIFL